jgi:hypothetical protein
MFQIPLHTQSFFATSALLAVGARARFRLLLKLPTGCRA